MLSVYMYITIGSLVTGKHNWAVHNMVKIKQKLSLYLSQELFFFTVFSTKSTKGDTIEKSILFPIILILTLAWPKTLLEHCSSMTDEFQQ